MKKKPLIKCACEYAAKAVPLWPNKTHHHIFVDVKNAYLAGYRAALRNARKRGKK